VTVGTDIGNGESMGGSTLDANQCAILTMRDRS